MLDFMCMVFAELLATESKRKIQNEAKQNRESTKGYSRWKVEWRHGKFEELISTIGAKVYAPAGNQTSYPLLSSLPL